MRTIETVLLILLVLDAIALVALVLVQQSKGSDIGAAFGSGGANTVFGTSATSFLTKLTASLAATFFVVAFGLAYTASERAASLRSVDLPGSDTLYTESSDLPETEGAPIDGDDLPQVSDESSGSDSEESAGDDMPALPSSEPEGEPNEVPDL